MQEISCNFEILPFGLKITKDKTVRCTISSLEAVHMR